MERSVALRWVRSILLVLGTSAAFGQTVKVERVPNPAPQGSVEAHWGSASDGSPLLSWIEPADGGDFALRYSVRHGGQWSETRTIVAKRHFFRQPAESPSVVSFPDGALLAEWVEVPEAASGAEYIFVSASVDGVQWTTPVMANEDRSPVQHALVSMALSGAKEASLIWLEALKGEDEPSRLKRTVVSSAGKILKEEILESDVCTCCPTSIVRTARGLLVAYRGHTPKDIRDIGIKRFENGKWLPASILNPDNWEINACPVNGASAAARANRVAIAWYTEGGDKPRVQLVFSTNGGLTFGKPIMVNTGDALGHASAVITGDGGAFVSWIEEGENSSRLFTRFISAFGVAGPAVLVTEGATQNIGYPRLLQSGKETWIAWGNSAKGRVQTAKLLR